MNSSERYSINRQTDRLWVVVDKTRDDRAVGHASNEAGAQRIASLLTHLRRRPPAR